MNQRDYNKKKIFNDPVYGFISLPFDILFDIIEHPYFQRLRRIKQLGLTHLVYPGALHTRFHHALGAMHLTHKAIGVLKSKGHEVNSAEEEATLIAILLHDIGHGPFSHALEYSIVSNITHENISTYFMEYFNREFEGKIQLAIDIFKDRHPKKFLHQLVSSQLDMDRLDYLKRDSLFTGVSEGIIGSDRIISMLNIKDGNLVIEAKGIYSIEKFIVARRLMYWQVYLHKTVLSAENLVVHVLKRAKFLANQGEELFGSEPLRYFLYNETNKESFEEHDYVLDHFAQLDDYDIMGGIKMWRNHKDSILSALSTSLLNRNLYHIEIQNHAFSEDRLEQIQADLKTTTSIHEEDLHYFIFSDSIQNNAYNPEQDKIELLYKDGSTTDVEKAADQLNIRSLSEEVIKYYLCYPKQSMVENLKKS